MTVSKHALFAVMLFGISATNGQQKRVEPHIGYLYPAGGRQGATFEVLIGGQQLKDVTSVYVSGEGLEATVIQYYRPVKNLDADQRRELQRQLRELTARRRAESSPERQDLLPAARMPAHGKRSVNRQEKESGKEPVTLPEHPLLRDMENKTLQELVHIRQEFFKVNKRQPNTQIAESVLIEVTIDPKAAVGEREIRLGTPSGLTNPMRFEVGQLPEACEQEPNDPHQDLKLPEAEPVDLPIVMNGQIQPGDVDRFRFRAKQGQRLVIQTQARRLIPYLADAVPGWFQATLAVFDEEGKEVAYDDDYRFDPDPVLLFQVPETAVYEVEIRDSIYRGREDFVYRIAVGQQPFVTESFPLGGQKDVRTVASIDGWNLPKRYLLLDTRAEPGTIQQAVIQQKDRLSNSVIYGVDTLPECNETEPNDAPDTAQSVELPKIINGRISKAGDVDVFQIEGGAGQEFVAEIYGRRLDSPLDSLLRLTDAEGRVLEWNDDHEDRESGLRTHHADSYLLARLPEDGIYYVHLTDAQSHGGKAYSYRLRVGPSQPDFALRVTPSSVNVRAGGCTPIHVYAVRKDGFAGAIELVLKDAPAGFQLQGSHIPVGCDHIRMTLAAPPRAFDEPVVLEMEGRARVGGQDIRRPTVPAEDMMQAFLYRHLAPSQELMVCVIGKRAGPPLVLAETGRVQLPVGGVATVRIQAPRRPMLQKVGLELSEPPEGVTLQSVTVVPGGLTFRLMADEKAAQVGYAGNLIVEAFMEASGRGKDGQTTNAKKRMPAVVLPAIPFQIVER